MTSRKVVVATLVGMLVIFLIIPFERTVMLPVSVGIVDQAGNSISNVLVKQEWRDVLIENEMHVEFVRTDENGVASFPNRTVRSLLLKRLFTTGWRILTQGQHASIWPYGTLTAYANDDPYVWAWAGYYSGGGTWPERLYLKSTYQLPYFIKDLSSSLRPGNALSMINSCIQVGHFPFRSTCDKGLFRV